MGDAWVFNVAFSQEQTLTFYESISSHLKILSFIFATYPVKIVFLDQVRISVQSIQQLRAPLSYPLIVNWEVYKLAIFFLKKFPFDTIQNFLEITECLKPCKKFLSCKLHIFTIRNQIHTVNVYTYTLQKQKGNHRHQHLQA